MKITKLLRKWAEENIGLPKGSPDDTATVAITSAMANGKLTAEKFVELQQESQKSAADELADKVADRLATKATRTRGRGEQLLLGSGPGTGPRVKDPSERYSHTKSVRKHDRWNYIPADHMGREVESASEYETAALGAFVKSLASRAPIGALRGVQLSDHEQQLVEELYQRNDWCGNVGGDQWEKQLSGLRFKAILNDSTSGGTNVVPEFFDANLIQFPLLTGELFPMVTTQEVPRGSVVDTASVGNPTVTWGTPEGTSISLFNTDSLLAAISTTIHTVTVAIEIGRDLLSDSPADVGRVVQENLGQRLAAELDKVIAVGNGTNQPLGLFEASGLGSATTGGTWTVDDIEEMLFAVGKQYRTSGRCAFVCNDTSYARIRALQNDASGNTDVRRVFGMDHESYTLLGRPVRIQNDIANTKAMFGDLSKYRLYRRLGFSFEFETGGESLMRRNLALLVVRGRFGGQVMDGSAFAKATDAPA